jgi:hypothetical protein
MPGKKYLQEIIVKFADYKIMTNKEVVYAKIEKFIRKHYLNRIIKGFLLSVMLLALFYLVFVGIEYFLRLNTAGRAALFFIYLAASLLVIIFWIAVPLLKMINLAHRMTYDKAAVIIGEHFGEVRDKLLNVLQLITLERETKEQKELLHASIDQKINTIRTVPFSLAIRLKANMKYLKYVGPPVVIIIAGLLVAPSLVKEPAERIVKYNEKFARKFPFEMNIVNERLETLQQDDFELIIRVKGEEIPADWYLIADGVRHKMKKGNINEYTYLFRKLQEDIKFNIRAEEFISETIEIKVLPKPIILNFDIFLDFPEYLDRQKEKVINNGELVIPEGTLVKWDLVTKDVTGIAFIMAEDTVNAEPAGEGKYEMSKTMFQSVKYSIVPENQYTEKPVFLDYQITVLADGYPSIVMRESNDSATQEYNFYDLEIQDDHGFSRLTMNYLIFDGADTIPVRKEEEKVPINRSETDQYIVYAYDFGRLLDKPGYRTQYYFEVWDNDAIHGPKSARTSVREIRTLSEEELKEKTRKNEQEIIKTLENSLSKTEDIEEIIDELEKRMIEKDQISWQEKKTMEEMIGKNEEILKEIEKIKQQNMENLQNEERFSEEAERIIEKQRKLNEYLEQLLDEELRKKLEELREMMKQLDKEKMNEIMKELKMTNNELEEQLDRNLELFKRIEFERNFEEQIKALEKIAEEQKKMAQQEKGNMEKEEQAGQQKEMNDRYDSLRQELKSLEKQSDELNMMMDMKALEPLSDSIDSSMDEVMKDIENAREKQRKQKQEGISEKMQTMADSMKKMREEAENEQTGEDMGAIRKLLENLIEMSFEQEELMHMTREINRNDPKYIGLITRQKEVEDKLRSVKDTLLVISRRQFMLQPVIAREIKAIDENIMETVDALVNRNLQTAAAKEQFTMTAINNLALLLEESMEEMNRQMNMNMQGMSSKSCKNKNSGKGKKSMKEMKKMQDMMSEQLEKMKSALEKQLNSQGKKSQQGKESEQMNEQIARLAAQQEAIRREMQKYAQYLKELGIKENGEIQKSMQEMELNEKDLINKQITRETLERQKKIMTRLLESERAEEKREMEEKRESTEAKSYERSNPEGNFKYKSEKDNTEEQIRFKNLPVNHYYRDKVSKYMIKVR